MITVKSSAIDRPPKLRRIFSLAPWTDDKHTVPLFFCFPQEEYFLPEIHRNHEKIRETYTNITTNPRHFAADYERDWTRPDAKMYKFNHINQSNQCLKPGDLGAAFIIHAESSTTKHQYQSIWPLHSLHPNQTKAPRELGVRSSTRAR